MFEHQAVLLERAVDSLVGKLDGCYVDGTFGRGGHSKKILERIDREGKLLAIDKDPEAVEAAVLLGASDSRLTVRQGSFSQLEAFVSALGWNGRVQGVLLDLGVSSPQLDDSGRGFSFLKDGPLDMRMNPEEGMTAAQWLEHASAEEIASVLHEYGEERFSRRIARAIVRHREKEKIESTRQLAELIRSANPSREKHKHPATRSFQAIRIHINNELAELEEALEGILKVLAPGGRMVIISFHSLEDRLVKQFIKKQEKGDDFPPGVPVTAAQLNPRLKRVGKIVKAEGMELSGNPRARSAVMRVAEKIPAAGGE